MILKPITLEEFVDIIIELLNQKTDDDVEAKDIRRQLIENGLKFKVSDFCAAIDHIVYNNLGNFTRIRLIGGMIWIRPDKHKLLVHVP